MAKHSPGVPSYETKLPGLVERNEVGSAHDDGLVGSIAEYLWAGRLFSARRPINELKTKGSSLSP